MYDEGVYYWTMVLRILQWDKVFLIQVLKFNKNIWHFNDLRVMCRECQVNWQNMREDIGPAINLDDPQQQSKNCKFKDVSNVEICDDGKIRKKYKESSKRNILEFFGKVNTHHYHGYRIWSSSFTYDGNCKANSIPSRDGRTKRQMNGHVETNIHPI